MRSSFALLLLAAAYCAGAGAAGQTVAGTDIRSKQSIDLPVDVHRATATRASTVVLLSGCAGPRRAHFRSWIHALTRWGYNAVVVDSIAARGVQQICDRPTEVVTAEQRSVDLFHVAKWILSQDWATAKVAVIGFSHGGWAVLHAAAARDVGRNFGQQLLSAAVAFYPWCDAYFHVDRPTIPVQIHIGGRDTWTPANLCKDLAQNWGMLKEFRIYRHATHAFDVAGIDGDSLPDLSGNRHALKYIRKDADLAMRRTRAFLDRYLK